MTLEASDIAKMVGSGLGALVVALFAQRKKIPESRMDRPEKLTIDSAHYRLGQLETKFEQFQDQSDDRHEQNVRNLRRVLKKLNRQEQQNDEILSRLIDKP